MPQAIAIMRGTRLSAEQCLGPLSCPYEALRRAAHLLKSATSEGQKSNQEMIPSPDFRMAGSEYMVVEAHGAEGCVAYAQ